MTDVEFHYNSADSTRLAARLTAGFVTSGRRVLIVASAPARYEAIDRALWTFTQLSFVPHCGAGDDVAPETPVWLTRDPTVAIEFDDVLINLNDEIPTCFSRFSTAVEVVGCDETERAPGRVRYKFYVDRGYKMVRFDHQGA